MKKILAIIGTVVCVLFMGGCVDVCAGLCIGLPILGCGMACSQCSAGSYPFMHETDGLDEVRIELVELNDCIFYGSTAEEILSGTEHVAEIRDKEKFLDEFLALRSTIPFGDPELVLYGKTICLTYPDGQIELITESACALVTDKARITDRNFLDDNFELLWDKWAQS